MCRFSSLCLEYLGRKEGEGGRAEYLEENCRIIHGEFAFLKVPCALRPGKEYVLDLCVSLSHFAVM